MDRPVIQEFRKNLHKLERKLAGLLDGDSACCGVTVAQCHTLLAIEEKDSTTVTELAADLELDKSTLSRTIDGLVQMGLAARETNSGNRRSLHIFLTAQGRDVVAAINDQWNRYFDAFFASVPESKHEAVLDGISILARLIPDSGCCRQTGCSNEQEPEGAEKATTVVEAKISGFRLLPE